MLSIFLVYFFSILLFFIIWKKRLFGVNTSLFLSILITLEGFSIVVIGSYIDFYFGLLVLTGGLYFFFKETSAFRIDNILSISNNLSYLFIFLGIFGIFTIIFFNKFYINDTFGTNDYIAFIFCSLLIFYKYLYSYNPFFTNFSTLSMFFLILLLSLPRLFVGVFFPEGGNIFDTTIVNLFLNVPLSNTLDLLGYSSYSDASLLRFHDTNGEIIGVNIGRTCSGLHSVALFISGFTAYVLAARNNIDIDSLLFILLGIFMSYLANLLRMLIIVLVGIHHSLDAMLWVHHYLGWFFFTIWFYIFWQIYMFFNRGDFSSQ